MIRFAQKFQQLYQGKFRF